MRSGALTVSLSLFVASTAAVGSAHSAEIRVDASQDLQEVLSHVSAGDTLVLAPGVYAGPVRIEKEIVLRGSGAIVDGGGNGTPVVVAAPNVRLEGLVIRDSGVDIGAPDACLYLEPDARDAIVRDCELRRCAFGIWVHETPGAKLVGNRIRGRPELRMADRGNGIHLFDASGLVVRENVVQDVRDGIYVSATEDSLIEANVARHVRFGIHYMYSYRNRVLSNTTSDSTVGIALMESRDLVVDGNRATGNKREGILFRDVISSRIRDNVVRENGTGMFFYSSVENVVADNDISDNTLGLKVWAGSVRNRVEGNRIAGNQQQVFYVAAEDQIWGESGRGNQWGDYLGWDQDGDGVGDRPYRVDSFKAQLLVRYPSAAWLLRSPALELLEQLADRVPLLRAPTIIDRSPLVAKRVAEASGS